MPESKKSQIKVYTITLGVRIAFLSLFGRINPTCIYLSICKGGVEKVYRICHGTREYSVSHLYHQGRLALEPLYYRATVRILVYFLPLPKLLCEQQGFVGRMSFAIKSPEYKSNTSGALLAVGVSSHSWISFAALLSA